MTARGSTNGVRDRSETETRLRKQPRTSKSDRGKVVTKKMAIPNRSDVLTRNAKRNITVQRGRANGFVRAERPDAVNHSLRDTSEDERTQSIRLQGEKDFVYQTNLPTEDGSVLEPEGEENMSLERALNKSPTSLSARRNRRIQNIPISPVANAEEETVGRHQSCTPDRYSGSTNADSPETFLPVFNQVKTQLLEAQRDKRVYAATVISQADKIEILQRELQHKSHQILSLELSLNKKTGRSNKKGNVWSQESLDTAGIAKYQGICLAVGRIGSKQSLNIITESFIDPDSDNIRRRDWRSSATAVSEEVSKAAGQCVKLPNGIPGIPTCVMARALEMKFYSSPYNAPSGFLKECLKSVLSSPTASFMSEDEKRTCEAKLSSHRPTIQKFRAILSDSIGNRKKIARNTYLRSLGYYNAVRPSSKKDTETITAMRDREKNSIKSKCVKILDSGKASTTFWRTSDWKDLCHDVTDSSVAGEMKQTEEDIRKRSEVDCWFLNEAARRAFLELRGYSSTNYSDDFANDVSIITLARADAAMTTMLKMITIGGRGGIRNNGFVESFRDLLPIALEVLIKEIWMDISEKANHELCPFIGGNRGNEDDPYGNHLRDHTIVQINPDDNYIHLVASVKYLRENVCCWLGNIKDAHIGRCKQNEEEFTMMNRFMKFDEDETSDIDGLSCDDIDSSDIHSSATLRESEIQEHN